MKDTIYVENLKVFGYHGVYEKEKTDGQFFLVTAIIDTDFSVAANLDDLSRTVDYGNVCLYIKKYFEETRHDLLECVVEELGTKMMYSFPGIHRLELKVIKPKAPIPMDFDGVGVSIVKEWTPVAISFGSNIEPREEYVTTAIEKIISNPAIKNMVVSDYIETEPYGYEEQDKFLNGAATFETLLSPEELLVFLNELEQEAGRKREIHWGPRTLDLDIELYGDQVISTKNLNIPHLDMCNRAFVLVPLSQIAPGWVHPVRRRTIYDLGIELKQRIMEQEKND